MGVLVSTRHNAMTIKYFLKIIDIDTDEVIFESVYPRSEMRLDNHEEYIEEEYRKREAAIVKYAEDIAEESAEIEATDVQNPDDPADEDTPPDERLKEDDEN